MNKKDKEIYTLVIFLGVAVWGFLVCANVIYGKNALNYPPIRSDGHGYYMYLPAFFIYNDPGMHFLGKLQDVGSFATTYFATHNGSMLDKYTMGVAILQSPFFLVAHLVTTLKNMPTDGFGFYYQWGNIISGLFYYVVGSCFTVMYLKRYVGRILSILAVLIITFGSNVFHYATYDGSFSHIYSYAVVATFLWYLDFYEQSDKSKLKQFFGGLILGLIGICRIPNLIIGIVYILYGVNNLDSLKRRLIYIIQPQHWIFAMLGFAVAMSPQMMYWKCTTGKILIDSYSYGGNRFDKGFANWSKPQIFNVLFSIKRGLFFWSPITLVAMFGLPKLKKEKNIFVPICVFMILFLYITSSWWTWSYGAGYSHRVFVDIMPIFALLLALLLKQIWSGTKVTRGGVCVVIAIAIAWGILGMNAYWRGVIPFDDAGVQDIHNMVLWFLNGCNLS